MRSLSHLTQNGAFLMLALDHRGSFAHVAGTKDPHFLIDCKYRIIQSVYDHMSGLLIDQDYGIPAYQQFIKEKTLINPKPFLTCIEASGYENQNDEKINTLQYTVDQLKGAGASGVKLLMFFNPDGTVCTKQLQTAHLVMERAIAVDLPYFLEIVTYPLPNRPYDKSDAILRSLRMAIDEGILPDVFKLEYPGNAKSCETITSLLGHTPWILLTRGDTFETFRENLKTAITAGAKGFLAGRAVWQEFPQMKTDEQQRHFFEHTIPSRFQEMCSIVKTGMQQSA